jgi:hypothetical protein
MSTKITMHYTDRDFALLRSLFESRLMSRVQIAAIHFAGHERMAKKRVQKLTGDGLIEARPRRLDEPKLHFLTKRGFLLLQNAGHLADYPQLGYPAFRRRIDVSPFTQAHEVAVADVKSAFFNATHGHHGVTVAEFSTWPLLFRFRSRVADSGRLAWFSPDGFIRLHETDPAGNTIEQLFYLEVDRSTEVIRVLCRKAQAFLNHFQTGGMAVRFGRPRDEFKQFAFRVLWVFLNAERRNNAAAAFSMSNPPIVSQAWMTTFDEVIANPMGSIWIRPKDYVAAVRGTPYEVSQAPSADPVYRRQTAREEHVESVIQKSSLLG